MPAPTTVEITRTLWQADNTSDATHWVAMETPVALVFNGISHVVMMSTPADLEEFALGFSLSEGILETPEQLLDCHIEHTDSGIEVQLMITAKPFAALKQRRRNLVGRTGCGLCGAESLQQAIVPPTKVSSTINLDHRALQRAIAALGERQRLQIQTGAVHGAAWCDSAGKILLVREDVGRHNALDKLLGARCRQFNADASSGFVLVTSRASYEMVAKTTSANIPLLASISAPTALAIKLAEQSGLTLIGFARAGRHAIYTHPHRISSETP